MTLAERRRLGRVRRAILKLVEQDGDHCSICGRQFANHGGTHGGLALDGSPALVGDCCLAKLAGVYVIGVYLRPGQGVDPKRVVELAMAYKAAKEGGRS